MPLVPAQEIVTAALKGGYAVGHFDIHNLEWTQAVLSAAEEEQSAVILGITEDAVRYFSGYTAAVQLVKALIKEMDINVPVVLHLDHGSSAESCKKAVDAGFTSVMIDASHYSIQKNIEITREVTDYAHKHGVSVEAEAGSIGGEGNEAASVSTPLYADPGECEELVKQTGIDFLAPALGSVHGLYKGEPKLGFEEMKEIAFRTKIPLVLHGSSGLSPKLIRKAISCGTAKINVNADNHLAFTHAVRTALNKNPDIYEASEYLSWGRKAVQQTVRGKIRLFGSSGKA